MDGQDTWLSGPVTSATLFHGSIGAVLLLPQGGALELEGRRRLYATANVASGFDRSVLVGEVRSAGLRARARSLDLLRPLAHRRRRAFVYQAAILSGRPAFEVWPDYDLNERGPCPEHMPILTGKLWTLGHRPRS